MGIPTRNSGPAASTADSPSSRAPDSKRRRFLLTLGLGSAGVAAGAAASVAAVTDITTPEPAPSADGYRETAHVRDYYRTAGL